MRRSSGMIVPALFVMLATVPVDLTGTWRGEVTDPQGNTQSVTLILKANAEHLSGGLFLRPDAPVLPIMHGTVDGNRISFEVERVSASNDTLRLRISALLDGNQLTGTVTGPRGDSGRIVLRKVSGDTVPPANVAERTLTAEPPVPDPRGPNPVPEPAQRAILAAFDTHAIVGGFGVTDKDADDFLLALVRNPAFAGRVNDIAIECGNSRYQPLLDRYTAGEDVPFTAVEQVWRNTTQPNCGFSSFYPRLVSLVRRINARLAPARRLRVLACDPPIDWTQVRTASDIAPFRDRDRTIADVLVREVLARHRKALMPFGINHLRHGSSAARLIERDHHGAIYVVAEFRGFGESSPLARYDSLLERRMVDWPVPSLVAIKGSWLADLEAAYYGVETNNRGYPGVDALLYLGPRDLLLREPIAAGVALDQDYLTELERRAAIRGFGPSSPRAILDDERRQGVMLFPAPAGPGGGR